MREIRQSGSEGGGNELNHSSLPLSRRLQRPSASVRPCVLCGSVLKRLRRLRRHVAGLPYYVQEEDALEPYESIRTYSWRLE